MEVLNLIVQLEKKLKAYVGLLPHPSQPDTWTLEVQLHYEGAPAGTTTFNLHGYSQAEAEAVARDIKNNAFLMHEIDQFLWGESD